MYLLVSDIFPSLFDLYTKTLVSFLFWQITVRALGCELGKEEMKRIVSQFGKEGSGKLSFKSFLQVVTQKMVCEPIWSQRVTFPLPDFTMQVATVDWVGLAPCRGETGVVQGFPLSYFRGLPSGELSLPLLPLSLNYGWLVQIETAATQQKSFPSQYRLRLPWFKPLCIP